MLNWSWIQSSLKQSHVSSKPGKERVNAMGVCQPLTEVKPFVHGARPTRVTIIKATEKYYLRNRGNDKGCSPKTIYQALTRALSDVQG